MIDYLEPVSYARQIVDERAKEYFSILARTGFPTSRFDMKSRPAKTGSAGIGRRSGLERGGYAVSVPSYVGLDSRLATRPRMMPGYAHS